MFSTVCTILPVNVSQNHDTAHRENRTGHQIKLFLSHAPNITGVDHSKGWQMSFDLI